MEYLGKLLCVVVRCVYRFSYPFIHVQHNDYYIYALDVYMVAATL